MVAGLGSPVRSGRRYVLTRLGVAAGLVLAVVVMAVGIPIAQEAWLTNKCSEQGGQLARSAKDLEPLLAARTVDICYGSNGQVLDKW